MADGEGYATRLGRWFNNQLAKLERSEVSLVGKAETKDAGIERHDVAQMETKRRWFSANKSASGAVQKPLLFSSETLAKWENAGVSGLSHAESKHADFQLRDVAQMKQKELEHPLFSLVSGGETVHHSQPKAPVTPSLPVIKLREI